MERTGTNQTELRQLLHDRCGITISKPHMSGILTGRWRCSLEKAVAFQRVTGVPVEKLVTWPKRSLCKTSGEAA